MTNTMKAVEISEAGGPQVLRLVDRPVPAPQAGEVLIRVHAAGVNGHDLHQRARGQHPIKPGETDLPGLEVAGEVTAIGDEVESVKVGDAVCALLRGGGYAEYAVAPAAQCLSIPSGLGFTEAAALPEACFTVWSNVYLEGALKPGEKFLMNGATSGIGVTAVQLVAALGNEVFGTAGGVEKCRFVEELGASRAIDYLSEDFEEVVKDATQGKGVDLILEIVCGDYLQKDLNCLALGGRLVVIGAARGLKEELDLRPMVLKQLHLTGTLLRPRSPEYKEQVAQALRTKVWPLIDQGRFKIIVDSVFPLEQAAAAHQKMEERQHVGKVILKAL